MIRPFSAFLGRTVLFLACVSGGFFGGYAGGSPSGTGRIVEIGESRSAFHQTSDIQSWSVAYLTDPRGNRWPNGITLSGSATKFDNGGAARLLLEFRYDKVFRGGTVDLDAAYLQARERMRQLAQTCRRLVLTIDGQPVSLPVLGTRVRVLTDRERMPEPATDQVRDHLAEFIAHNPPDHFVLSTSISAQPDRALFERLSSAAGIRYEVCGQTAAAEREEIAGLKRVREWAF